MEVKSSAKHSLLTTKVRRFIEPGPIVLISSAYNIMTCGWHMMMGYDLIAAYIWSANHSQNLIRKSRKIGDRLYRPFRAHDLR